MTQQFAWHTKTIPEIFSALRSRESGLTKNEAERRLQKYGLNKLPEGKTDGFPSVFLRQFQSPLIYILLVAAAVVFVISEVTDALVIFAVLFFNAIVGTIQEGRAQNTLLALKKFSETSATVMRDGKELMTRDIEIVPGDVIILREGEKIPADARIIFAGALTVDEASITGESEPVSKTDAIQGDGGRGRKNMLFKGAHVLSGNGTAIAVATGLQTEIGRIAGKISAVDTEIPLKTNIRYLSRLIILAVSVISILLVILGLASGKPVKEMFATAVALSVSMIPEGLPIVMTLILATGVRRMSKRRALVKKLQAVEALGQTKIIAVDKTGTLTRNEMVVQQVSANGKIFEITGNGYEPKGEAILDGQVIDPLNHPELLFSAKIAAFCANARLSFLPDRQDPPEQRSRAGRARHARRQSWRAGLGAGGEDTGAWKIAGDSTEAAMLVFSEKIGFRHDILEREAPKILELPFDYRRKYHMTVRAVNGKNFLTIAGAPETVLGLCKKIWRDGKAEALGATKKKELELEFQKIAQNGFRVVAYAVNPEADFDIKNFGAGVNPATESSLVFVGFFGMRDALRPEVKEAVQRVKAADMRVVMITGDHRLTAQAVAKEAGIYREGDTALTGEEIDAMSDDELAEKLINTTVFARVTPDHKFRVIQAYRKQGEIVAMTGDGVNDAPSLVAADLGVAMGRIGTEVAKEASDIVLLDDNFASIVSAVEEGRSIYKTIKKVILYLFSTSAGEALTITGAIALGYPLPILPAQIIWLNFVTDGFLDVALAMEPKEKGLMRGKFERPKKWLVDGLMARRMFLMALPMAAGSLYLFRGYFEADIVKSWTIALTAMAVFQWFNAWNCRSESKSIFRMNPFSNKFLIAATAIVVSLQFAALYTPFLQKVLRTRPISLFEWLMIASIASSVILVEEIRKFFYRRKTEKEK